MQIHTNNQTKARNYNFGTDHHLSIPVSYKFLTAQHQPLSPATQPEPLQPKADERAALKALNSFPELDTETRTHVDTACAAYWLNRKAQTLRMWACFENGPIRPVRVNGRLAWPVKEIRGLMVVGGQK